MNDSLEALKRFKQPQMMCDTDWNKRVSIIEKDLEALKIIKEKNPNIWIVKNTTTVKAYNEACYLHEQLTEEEYNILKGVIYGKERK